MPFAEEILLLALDDDTGRPRPMPSRAFVSAMAGAMLFDLAFAGRLDNDLDEVFLIEGPGEIPEHLREVHANLASQGSRLPLSAALAVAALAVPGCLEGVCDRLVRDKVLARVRRFSSKHLESYEKLDWTRVNELRSRIRETLLSDDPPDSGDVVIVSLLSACGLDSLVLTPDEADARRERLKELVRIEFLGREIFKAVEKAGETPFEETAAGLLDGPGASPGSVAGGVSAVVSAMGRVHKALGFRRGALALGRINQPNGFDCPSCAWPEPEGRCSRAEFCESGAKALASEATGRRIGPEFFEKWLLQDLAAQTPNWMESQGRLTTPMVRLPGEDRYRPATYEEAYALAADELARLDTPDQAVFYVSGIADNESAFLFQLLARMFGTNNLPNSINLCHEPSGAAMARSLGFGKGDAMLQDFEGAGAIFLFGHNPGSNHPRMLKTLQTAVRNGAVIVAVNPLPEAGLAAFANPHEVAGLLGRSTPLAHFHLPVRTGGDQALVLGMMKHLAEMERTEPGSAFDLDFIQEHTAGLEGLLQVLEETDWERIEEESGLSRETIGRAADIYARARSTVVTWGLGITHQEDGTGTIRRIIDLMLLKGNVGRPGSGLCPMRGHSNILGIRSMGCGHAMPEAFLNSLKDHCNFEPPAEPGLHAVEAIKALDRGRTRALLCLGGNPASAAPDTGTTARALSRADLTLSIATKLNHTHAAAGRTSIILPCLGRTETDLQEGKPQYVTVEDAMGVVHASRGCLEPVAPGLRSKPRIVAELARAVLDRDPGTPWEKLAGDYGLIRSLAEKVVPAYRGCAAATDKKKRFVLPNPLRKRDFSAVGGRARFAGLPLPSPQSSQEERPRFLLMSLRSHDQFNTTVYGLDDRPRGVRDQRRVVFLNEADMEEMGLAPEQAVDLSSSHKGTTRRSRGFFAIPYPIPRGCAAAYFPEANELACLDLVDEATGTPAYKSIPVEIAPSASSIRCGT